MTASLVSPKWLHSRSDIHTLQVRQFFSHDTHCFFTFSVTAFEIISPTFSATFRLHDKKVKVLDGTWYLPNAGTSTYALLHSVSYSMQNLQPVLLGDWVKQQHTSIFV